VPPARKSAARPVTGGVSPFDVVPAPVVVLAGTDTALADIATRRIEQAVRARNADVERHQLDTARGTPGDVFEALAPSLFGGARLVVVTGLEAAAGAVAADLQSVAAAWAAGEAHDDVTLVVRHAGGAGGKSVLAALRSVPGALDVNCTPPSNDRARAELTYACARSLGTAIDGDAVTALVQATGSDIAELLALTRQLVDMVDGRTISLADAEVLVGGRRDATGFAVADALIGGDQNDGLALLRHAQLQRVEPVLIIGALGSKLRTMARVAAAGRGSAASLARDLGISPWQIERAQRDLRQWTPTGLARALTALADADAAVKGEQRALPAGYALERAALELIDARSR